MQCNTLYILYIIIPQYIFSIDIELNADKITILHIKIQLLILFK